MRRALAVTLTLVILLSPLAALPATISMDTAAQEGNVTYTGTLSLSGTPVGDGATYQYDIADLDAAENFRIDVTGSTAFDRENATGTVSNGDTVPMEIAGNAEPFGPSGDTPKVELVGTETHDQTSGSFSGLLAGDTDTETVDGNQQPESGKVTFEGSESTTAASTSVSGATDGSSKDYEIGGNVDPEQPKLTFTGRESTGSRYTPSGTGDNSITVEGDAEPWGPSSNNEPVIEFTGRESTNSATDSGTVSEGGSASASIGGNQAPTGPANNEPRVNIDSATPDQATHSPSSDTAVPIDEGIEFTVSGSPDPVETLQISLSAGQDYESDETSYIEVRLESGNGDGDPQSGTLIGSIEKSSRDTSHTLDVSSFGNGGSVTVNLYYASRDSFAPSFEYRTYDSTTLSGPEPTDIEVSSDDGSTTTISSAGGSSALDLSAGSRSLTFDAANAPNSQIDWSLDYTERTATSDPAVDVTGDGSDDASVSGVLSAGETATAELASLSAGSVSVDTSVSAGPQPDWNITYDERLGSHDPAVDIDGDGSVEVSYSGTLLDGETATIEADLTTGKHTATTSLTEGSVDWTLDWTEITATEDPEINVDGKVAYGYSGILRDGETVTGSVSTLSLGSNSIEWGAVEDGGGFDATLSYDEVRVTEDPAVDTDGDGTYEITKTGELSPGSTVQFDAPGITRSVPSLSIATTNGSSVEVRAEYRERTKTDSPTVEVNGQTTDYAGIMDHGQTQTLQSDTAWLQSGTNRVNVSVGSGSLSADAPSPQVRFDYSHDAIDNQSVTYETEEWTERYSVSRSWSSDTSDAVLTIPFDGNVVSLRDAIKRMNGGSWSTIPEGERNLSTAGGSSTLDIELGSVSAGTVISVRVNGSKVDVNNGAIDVLQSTEEGRRLNSKIELTSWAEDSYIMMPSSGSWNRVPYAYNESWGADDRVWINSDGEKRLRLPNAIENGVMRVSTIPVEAAPETGDVIVEVNEVNRTNPEFQVRPGQQQGDKVAFTFIEATDGTTYELWSASDSERRDSGTAESPLTLSDDDSEETMVFRPFSGSSDDSDGPIITGRVPMPTQQGSSTAGIVMFAGVGMILLLGVFWYVRRRARPDKGIARTVAQFIATPVVIAGLGILATVIALNYNLLGLPPTVKLIGGLAGILTAAFYILRRLGMFQWRVFGVIAFVVGVLGAEALRPGLLGIVLGSDAFEKLLPLLALAGVYLAYKVVQTWRRGQVTKIVVGGRSR